MDYYKYHQSCQGTSSNVLKIYTYQIIGRIRPFWKGQLPLLQREKRGWVNNLKPPKVYYLARVPRQMELRMLTTLAPSANWKKKKKKTNTGLSTNF
jgi:hypothetical protein